jgi:hypothetical protein
MLCNDVINVFNQVLEEINPPTINIQLKIVGDKNFENRYIVEMEHFRQKRGRYKKLNGSNIQMASVVSFLVFTHTLGDTGSSPIEIYDLQKKPFTSEYTKSLFGVEPKKITQLIVVLLAARVAIRIANPNLESTKEGNAIKEILSFYDLRDEDSIIRKLLSI